MQLSNYLWLTVSWCFSLLVGVLAIGTSHATEADWVGGPTGDWSNPANWSTGLVPDFQTNVSIDSNPGQSSETTLDQILTVANLTLDEGDSLTIADGKKLTASSLFLAGSLDLNGSATLEPTGLLWVKPTGRISLGDVPQTGNSSIKPANQGAHALWNEGLIEGAGTISRNLLLNNQGIIRSNLNGQSLTFEFSPYYEDIINSGSLLAEGGELILKSPQNNYSSLLNHSGLVDGLIQARGDSMMLLDTLTVIGGEISTSSLGGVSPGVMQLQNVTLQGVQLEGHITAAALSLRDRVVNNSLLELVSSSSYSAGINLQLPATLAGTGTLQLNNGRVSPSIFSGTSLVNEAGHTIAGPGLILMEYLIFENHGVLEAQVGEPGQKLAISFRDTFSRVNSGVIRAADSATLEFSGAGLWQNYEGDKLGVIEADLNSTISLAAMTLEGGILRSLAPPEGSSDQAGKFLSSFSQPSLLNNVRLEGPIGDGNNTWRLGGTITNTEKLQGYGLKIESETILTGGGEVRIGNDSGNGSGGIEQSFTATSEARLVNVDNEISATGVIDLDGLQLINRAVIQTRNTSSSLTIRPRGNFSLPMINSGLIQATSGNNVLIEARITNFEGSTIGTIHAAEDSQVQIRDVEGGVLSTAGTGEILYITNSWGGELVNVRNEGTLRMGSGSALQLKGTMLNDGTIIHDTTANVFFGGTLFQLGGGGSWTSLQPFNLIVGSSSPTALVHGSEHTIRGWGSLKVSKGSLINHGTIEAQGSGSLTINLEQGSTMFQQGTLRAPAQQSLTIETREQRFKNEGIIDVGGDFLATRTSQGPLEFFNIPGSSILLGGGQLGLSTQNDSGSPITLWNQEGALLAGTGEINLLEVDSMHAAILRNSGVVRPGGDQNTTGQLSINGDFVQDATGSLELKLGGSPGTGWYDALALNDNSVSLGGTLDIALVDGFDPSIGDSFEIITTQGGTVSGAFDSHTVPALAGRWWQLDYLTDKVVLNVAAITADFDNNGFVDGDDLAEWQASYGLNALADADGDGDSDGQDFLAWQRQFGSGVPPTGTQAVPEPASGWMLALFTVGLIGRRRK